MRDTFNPFDLDDLEFRRRFRLTKPKAEMVINQLIPYIRNIARRSALSPRTRIFTALQFFATGSYQRLVGQSSELSMSQQSVSNCIREVATLITNHLAPNFIKFPATPEQKQEIKNEFFRRFNFPGIIGAIDCTHVRILCPTLEEHNYLNRKGYHSLNVQIICDAMLKILAINPRHGGATHDSHIWRMSNIKTELERQYHAGERATWLIGDSGYPLQPWLMTPILDAAPNTPAGRYTAAHCAARNCVERCNGVLKTRYRCILGERLLRYDPEMAAYIILACAVLHNISLEDIDGLALELFEDDPVPVDAPNVPMRFLPNEGQRQRQRLINQYFNN